MTHKKVDLKEISGRPRIEQISARLRGELAEGEAPVWGDTFAASGGGGKGPMPPYEPKPPYDNPV